MSNILIEAIGEIIKGKICIFESGLIENAINNGAVSVKWCDDENAWVLRSLNGTPVAAIYEDMHYINGNLADD